MGKNFTVWKFEVQSSCNIARTTWSVAIFPLLLFPARLATCEEIKLHSEHFICLTCTLALIL